VIYRSKQCKDCGRWMTWAEHRVQFGRLMRRGLDLACVKQTLPRCQKCVTKWLQTLPRVLA
jgi:hypothetical protein